MMAEPPALVALEKLLCAFFRSDCVLLNAVDSVQFCRQMLQDGSEARASSPSTCSAAAGSQELSSLATAPPSHGVSPRPFVVQLAQVLRNWWFLRGEWPWNDAEQFFVEMDGFQECRQPLELLMGLPVPTVDVIMHHHSSQQQQFEILEEWIARIDGARGLLTLLGMRTTVGSQNVMPLTRQQCIDAFNQRHCDREPLTVGARALAKHCARSSEGFWGSLTGNDAKKNELAQQKLLFILDNCVWKNVHALPHEHTTFEIRIASGYGMRWLVDDQRFRGFLEPPMANGHELKWRH